MEYKAFYFINKDQINLVRQIGHKLYHTDKSYSLGRRQEKLYRYLENSTNILESKKCVGGGGVASSHHPAALSTRYPIQSMYGHVIITK